MSRPIPPPIADALDEAIGARIDVDNAKLVNDEKLAALATATTESQNAAADLQAKTEVLDQARQKLEGLEDLYLKPGGTLPAPASPATPGLGASPK